MPGETSFQRAQGLLSSSELSGVEAILLAWSRHPVGVTVAPNVRDREHFLPPRYMVLLLRAFCGLTGRPISEVQAAYSTACHALQRKGGRAQVSSNDGEVLLGHAADLRLLAISLQRRYPKLLPTLTDAEDLLQRLQTDPCTLSRREREIRLQPFNAWVTWSWDDPSEDPFDFVTYGLSDEVRGALGLDQRISGALLLFRYCLPPRLAVHRATVADADLSQYFAPPIVTQKAHGFTRPWERATIVVAGKVLYLATIPPRPEAVHRPIQIAAVGDPPIALP